MRQLTLGSLRCNVQDDRYFHARWETAVVGWSPFTFTYVHAVTCSTALAAGHAMGESLKTRDGDECREEDANATGRAEGCTGTVGMTEWRE